MGMFDTCFSSELSAFLSAIIGMDCVLVPFQMSDVVENEAKMAYMRPPSGGGASSDEPRAPSKGFVVREAPWTSGSEKVIMFYFKMKP